METKTTATDLFGDPWQLISIAQSAKSKWSMTDLFRACYAEMSKAMVPLHYAEIAKRAIDCLGISLTPREFNRAKEDVREKMLQDGKQYPVFYVGKPYYMGAITTWYRSTGDSLINSEIGAVNIPVDLHITINAMTEALMRNYHLHTKTSVEDTVAGQLRRREGIARGFIIERHVSEYFKSNWRQCWCPPDNAGRWTEDCDHDFKLKLGNKVLKVDVMGPRCNKRFGSPIGGGKHSVDIHILSDYDATSITILGFNYGREFDSKMNGESTHPISRLIVPLNSHTSEPPISHKVFFDAAAMNLCKGS